MTPVLALVGALVAAALVAGGETAAPAERPAAELAFVRDGTIYLARVDGSGRRAVTRGFAPAWSPDGARLVFSRSSPGGSDLFVVDVNGRNLARLTRTRAGELTPSWSPDGRRIAYVSNLRGRYELYVMRSGGGGSRRVLAGAVGSGDAFLPAWSPDGRLIAFSSSAWTPENPEIYAVRPNGTGLRRLTRTRGSAEVFGDDSWPRWSPDGRRIVFSSNRTRSGEVWIMRADGSGQRRIAGFPRRDDWAPSFSPDGQWIAFYSLAQTASRIYLVRPNGTGLRRLGPAGTDPVFRP